MGPSISRDEARRLCPGLDLRPPARRGDLYREREEGAWGFLLIDGVFMQEDAVSPREVVDVLEDGALIVGASSMGALRAADCWPAGAKGIGLIYRLYRMGVLESDEEVAVAVSADGSDATVSVPLVNVRYAVARAVRQRLLDRATARQIVSAAAAIYYPERTWPEVLRRVGEFPPELLRYCAQIDLKRQDAERALSCVKQMLRDAGPLASHHGRRHDVPFWCSEASRERGYDATGGVDPEHLRTLLLEWLIGTGRLARLLPQSWPPVVADLDSFARSTWRDLEQARRLDAELMRLQASERATKAADDAGLAPRPRDVRLAQQEIATSHGFGSWKSLLASPHGRQFASQIARAQERLARAKRMRDAWFDPSSIPSGHDDAHRRARDAWEKIVAFLGRHLKNA
ncbi:MAG: hypothetical protein HY725_23395 [Candidatus Rokubacteria bacterium]|nr:hypothetical protein [Candidatus Rokubacteria bacterium]